MIIRAVFSLWILSLGGMLSHAAERPFNLLFIVVDDLRPALGCYDDPIAVTPHIDALAGRGTRFMKAYCQQAVCSPSRLSVLTGMRPNSIRVWDLATHFREAIPNAVTLPQYFKKAGYRSRSIGKIFHGGGKPAKDPPSWSVEPLFDVTRDPQGRYATSKNLAGTGLKRSSVESATVPDEYYVDGQVCEKALEGLVDLKTQDAPFFLAVGFRKPHLPFCAPKRYWDLYERELIPPPDPPASPKGAPELATRSWRELEGYTDIPVDDPLGIEKIQELRHGYYACVSYVDALVGRLLDQLERLGLKENTVVCLWGDHGFHLGEQGIWTKANNYELSTRVPLIVSVPGQANPGSRASGIVELVDLYPSLAFACGLPAPVGLDGVRFNSLFLEPGRRWKTAAFSQFPRNKKGHRHTQHGEIMGYAIRTERYRYVEWNDWDSGQTIASELYDHVLDPLEAENRVSKQAFAGIVKDLSKRLKTGWRGALPVGLQ